MATEKRLTDANAIEYPEYFYTGEKSHDPFIEGFHQGKIDAINDIRALAPTVDAVPVDDIRLYHILIDNEGVPEVKLQIGDRYFILHTDPVDVREVVHGRWVYYSTTMQECSNCHRHTARHKFKYCPHCGAVMEDKYHESTD